MKINNKKIILAITAITAISIVAIASTNIVAQENMTMTMPQENMRMSVTDTVFVPLNYQRLRPNTFILMYDSTPYPITEAHVVVYVNCDKDGVAPVQLAVGVAPDMDLIPLDMSNMIHDLSEHGNMCLYHMDLPVNGKEMTDIALINTSTKWVRLGPEAHAMVSVHEFGPAMEHGHMEHK